MQHGPDFVGSRDAEQGSQPQAKDAKKGSRRASEEAYLLRLSVGATGFEPVASTV
jgi:hypothetical protein